MEGGDVGEGEKEKEETKMRTKKKKRQKQQRQQRQQQQRHEKCLGIGVYFLFLVFGTLGLLYEESRASLLMDERTHRAKRRCQPMPSSSYNRADS